MLKEASAMSYEKKEDLEVLVVFAPAESTGPLLTAD